MSECYFCQNKTNLSTPGPSPSFSYKKNWICKQIIMDIWETSNCDHNAVKNEKMCNKTFLERIMKYYMRLLGTRKWMKFYRLSEMKICCWLKRKLETLWKVCVSFIIVLKRSQTLREMGLSCVHPLCKLNLVTPFKLFSFFLENLIHRFYDSSTSVISFQWGPVFHSLQFFSNKMNKVSIRFLKNIQCCQQQIISN